MILSYNVFIFDTDRLFQVEYAIEAVKLGSTAVGIRTEEGVVLAVEKRLTSTLLEPSSVEKIMEVILFSYVRDYLDCHWAWLAFVHVINLMFRLLALQVDDHIGAAVSGIIGGKLHCSMTLQSFLPSFVINIDVPQMHALW